MPEDKNAQQGRLLGSYHHLAIQILMLKTKMAMSVAAYYGQPEAIITLLGRGADIEARNRGNQTPLHVAIYKSQASTIITLLDRGADIEARDENGDTPLHIAVQRRQSEAILSLLDRGADAHAKNNKGKRAIDIANDRQIEKDKAYQQLQAASK